MSDSTDVVAPGWQPGGELVVRDELALAVEHADERAAWFAREPGWYTSISNEDYHACRALSNSRIGPLTHSVAHYLEAQRETVSMSDRAGYPLLLGSLVHAACFDEHDEWERLGLIARGEGPLDIARRCADSVRSHPAWRDLRSAAILESSFLFDLDEYPVPERVDPELTCLQGRCRPDMLLVGDGIIADLKTSSKPVSAHEWQRTIANWGYHRQAAWYVDGIARVWPEWECRRWLHVAVETRPPHLCAAYELAPPAIELGRDEYREAVGRLHEYLLAPRERRPALRGYNTAITEIDLPRWAYYRRNDR